MPTVIDGKLQWSPEELKAENAILRGNLEALVAALQRVEWIQDDLVLEPRRYCPCCDAQEKNGHYDSCQLKRALARARGAPASEWRE